MRIGLLFLLLPMLAIAAPDDRPPDNRPPDRTSDVDVTVSTGGAVSDSVATAASESVSTATNNVTNNVSLFGAGGEGGAGQQSSGSGGDQSIVSINEAKRPDDITIRNVPSISAPDVFPTVSCFKGTSFSLGVPGAGGSFGGGKIDEDCVKREYIRLAFVMGAIDRAVYMWCKQPAVYEDFGSVDECLLFESRPPPEPQVTRLELQNFATEPEVVAYQAQALQPVLEEVRKTGARIGQIEQRLDANAAADRRAAQEREQWKAELTQTYLTPEE